jgi:hypothetical protein
MKQDLNVYTVMLILAFLATMIGCVFLYLEMRAYDMQKTVPADLRAPTTLPSGPVAQGKGVRTILVDGHTLHRLPCAVCPDHCVPSTMA